ncbi:MAG: CoA-acylating methylmalonate-semialdehyde dehydrogenase [Alphaproteobacteria bacterium]|nr:MAG: CoA-acylating methylmalonate-semialdehyde dehydrogenase [Alphaproteobacteria bacterium]
MYQVQHFIDGHLDDGIGARSGKIFNPATGEQQGEVTFASVADVDRAVAAAKSAFPGWSSTSIMNRVAILFKFRELLLANKDRLTELLVKEHGKVWDDAAGELQRGFEVVEFACGIPQLLKGEFSAGVGGGIDAWSMRMPLGVVAAITPFNFPAMVPLWTAPIAIACGNTYLLKPSEKDPSSATLLGELFREAGLPDGVFNVVHGDKEAVDRILEHPDIEAVSFVGSTNIAEHIYQTGTRFGKRVQALGGAKNHAIIMPDADLNQAVDAMIGAAFGSAGERCMALSVAVTVGDEVADALVEKIVPRAREIKVGHGMDKANEMGPLITKEHAAKVRRYIEDGVQQGAELVVDGRGVKVEQGFEHGYWVGPTLFDKVSPNMSIYKDEIFGPVLAVVRAQSYDEAVELVQEHPYGNGTCIFTRDGDAARAFVQDIKVGMVGVNVPLPVPLAFHSFGGWKRSLFGDHHMYGPEGVRFFTRMKSVTARWPTSIRSGANLSFPTID